MPHGCHWQLDPFSLMSLEAWLPVQGRDRALAHGVKDRSVEKGMVHGETFLCCL